MIGQDQRLSEGIGEPGDALADPLGPLLPLEVIQGPRLVADQEIDQAAGVGTPRGDLLVEADRRVPARLPQGVDRLVRGDRVEPGRTGRPSSYNPLFKWTCKKVFWKTSSASARSPR